nr:BadF/BadG/BcrA/BcrD ATPase family protein [Saccharopolyspora sp. HNM0983]
MSGAVRGTGRSGGGNPNSHPVGEAAERIARATREALAGTDPGAVRAVVLGMAGSARLADPAAAERFARIWPELGLHCPVRTTGDSEVAFAAGTPLPRGTVLIAGTGAIAGRIEDHRLTRTAGGHGWLLGDEGSAFWLGREAVRTALAELDRREPPGALTDRVRVRLLGDEPVEDLRRSLITAAGAGPPIALAELAPVVTGAAQQDDPAARAIVARAAEELVAAVAVLEPDPAEPVVLAGGLLAPDAPLQRAVRARLSGAVRTAGSGAAGAAWLAARELAAEPDQLHARLLATGADGLAER